VIVSGFMNLTFREKGKQKTEKTRTLRMIRIIIVSSDYYVFHSLCVLGLQNNGLTVKFQLKTKAERWKWTW